MMDPVLSKESLPKLFHAKQIKVLEEYNQPGWRYLISDGAVRVGKTYINNILFLHDLLRVKEIASSQGVKTPNYILGGFSYKTIKNNVLNEIEELLNLKLEYDRTGAVLIFGVRVILAYTGTTRGMNSIRGVTSYGAYINEASLAHPDVFNEINFRCSGKGAHLIMDTNPDIPTHYLYKTIIEQAGKPDKDGVIRVRRVNFQLDDNTFLDPAYIAGIKATTPSGPYYDRAILGKWTTGDGAVYKDFIENKHMIDHSYIPFDQITYFVGGVDWGYEHYGALVVVGVTGDGTFYVTDAYAEKHKQVDYWLNLALSLEEKYGDICWYVDSARPEYYNSFYELFSLAFNGNKQRDQGIEYVAGLFKQDKIFISKNTCQRLLDELYAYSWDQRTGQALKENDDVMDALRYALYSYHIHGRQENINIKIRGFR